eukprot:XP_011680593.1 PREDICTED: uncharacterized protein LOC100888290 [Strongylocentrotus purpuratus]
MDAFCLLYLLMILLMRSGDVETNPGPDRIVTEEEFIKLSTLIATCYYHKLGVNLKITIVELDHIKERSLNTSDALITVFTRWRDKQPLGTEIRALLAEGLERSDLGSLSGELLAGSLVPTRTGAPDTLPGSQTQPLSPDLIKRCADDFKFKYRTTLCKIRADPLDPDSIAQFKDMYTNLVLEEENRKRKRPLEYRDFFDLKVNGEFPKRIVIQGEAGAGKTTFCAKIAWDWINSSPVLPKFKWVLVVPLREAKQYTIGEIAKSYLSKDNPATACQITEYIRSNPKDVFIAFDGLDEFDGKVVQQRKAGSKSECHQPKSADQTKARGSFSERGDIALRDILRSDELEACPVLVTSRPWKVTEIRWDDSLRKLYTFIHVEGFSKENVEVYIHKYFEDDVATADQLIRLTKVNDIISENMAPYPIFIAMLCLMWRNLGAEKQEKFRSFRTFSQIFDEMFEFLKVHYAQKAITDLDSPSFQAYRSQIEKLMEPVAKVAFNGLQENTLIFREDDFEQCLDSLETACRVGVLSQEKRLSSVYDKRSPYLQSTIFFPHKLFQEYMAGVHLASLYELDQNEFNRLIKQVVLPRKEEFRYLLYFTVSQDKTIANHVMKCMVQGYIRNEKDRDFFVDVSFESQDLDTAALVRDVVSSLYINSTMKAHTVAGFIFTGIYLDVTHHLAVSDREFGPTLSHDLVEIICSAQSLKNVTLENASFHSDFYAVLAKEGNKSKVQALWLWEVRCQTSASLHHLVEALCSMPNLTELKIGGKDFQDEFYSTLNAKASSLQVKTLEFDRVCCPTLASLHHLVEALCSMPNLTDLIIGGKDVQKQLYSTLNAKASSLQVKTLELRGVRCPTSASSHHLIDALCSMPNLTTLRLLGEDSKEEIHSTLNAEASSLQVKTLKLEGEIVRCPTLASSHQLVDALCSMPILMELRLRGKEFEEEFYSTLNAKASTLQVRTLELADVSCPTSASSHHLVDALCSMPNLTNLTLSGKNFEEELYSTLNAKASTLQLKARILRVDHVSDYRKPKDDEELDDATKKLGEEGCAPKTPPTSDKEDEEELVLPIKGNDIPAKKKRTHDSNDRESTPIVKTKKKEDEDYRRKKEQTRQKDGRRIADGYDRKEKGESRRRYGEARSSYHSTRYEDDETKVKRREDEQRDRNYRWDRKREDKPRMDKRERERGRRDLDGESESEGRRDREGQRNDRSGEREDSRDRRDRVGEKGRERRDRERERQQDSRDRGGEREDNRDRRDRDRERERQQDSRDRGGEREDNRDRRDRDRERERQQDSRDRGGEREDNRDRRDRDRERERQRDSRDRGGEREDNRDRRDRDRERERQQDSRDRGGEREDNRDRRDRDRERERQRDSRDRGGEREDNRDRRDRDRERERQQDSRDRGGEREDNRDRRDRDRERERQRDSRDRGGEREDNRDRRDRDRERERQQDSRDRGGEREDNSDRRDRDRERERQRDSRDRDL